jgi:hypothetical protein
MTLSPVKCHQCSQSLTGDCIYLAEGRNDPGVYVCSEVCMIQYYRLKGRQEVSVKPRAPEVLDVTS